MARQIVRGELTALVEGPALLITVKGREEKFPLGIDLPLDWVQEKMGTQVMVMAEDGRITEII